VLVSAGTTGNAIRCAPEPCDCAISTFSCHPTPTIRCRCRGRRDTDSLTFQSSLRSSGLLAPGFLPNSYQVLLIALTKCCCFSDSIVIGSVGRIGGAALVVLDSDISRDPQLPNHKLPSWLKQSKSTKSRKEGEPVL
jgi:hypothetical protein